MSTWRLSQRALTIFFVWVLSLIAAGALGTVWAQREKPEPVVLSGSDIGFRVDRVDGNGVRVGALVVRVDGKWVDVEFGGHMRPAR
jgi:hypothetical protein